MILKSTFCTEEKRSQYRSETHLSRKNKECMMQRSYIHTHLQHTHTHTEKSLNHEIMNRIIQEKCENAPCYTSLTMRLLIYIYHVEISKAGCIWTVLAEISS